MTKIVMLKGLPFSGRTTWAMEKVRVLGWVRVGVKEIREAFVGGTSERREQTVRKIRNALIRAIVKQGRTAVVDDNNLSPNRERELQALADELGVKLEVADSFLQVPVEECVARCRRSMSPEREEEIWSLYNRWVRPVQKGRVNPRSDKRRCILVDLDGVLCRTQEDGGLGEVMSLGAFLVDCINGAGEFYCDVVIMTERSELCRQEVEAWLSQNALEYKELFMRKAGDNRPEAQVKREMILQSVFPKWETLGAIDNDLTVCNMLYNLGIDILKEEA